MFDARRCGGDQAEGLRPTCKTYTVLIGHLADAEWGIRWLVLSRNIHRFMMSCVEINVRVTIATERPVDCMRLHTTFLAMLTGGASDCEVNKRDNHTTQAGAAAISAYITCPILDILVSGKP
ncbi:uncharacterized protein LOC133890720 isoform X2 [Phragmites australis]|uniref:uncharacterized protein LOC133890720 isoform X2 n=1 Tax=Phragmites australis TaxID=29695 RepID=UPI002D778E5C|nr:uncharacterized protein LOC133890720 isoform X2 [Phragmites australis]